MPILTESIPGGKMKNITITLLQLIQLFEDNPQNIQDSESIRFIVISNHNLYSDYVKLHECVKELCAEEVDIIKGNDFDGKFIEFWYVNKKECLCSIELHHHEHDFLKFYKTV